MPSFLHAIADTQQPPESMYKASDARIKALPAVDGEHDPSILQDRQFATIWKSMVLNAGGYLAGEAVPELVKPTLLVGGIGGLDLIRRRRA
ncbi:MAG: hypothetical protein ACJ8AI_04370 [Rhodopila sp.]